MCESKMGIFIRPKRVYSYSLISLLGTTAGLMDSVANRD